MASEECKNIERFTDNGRIACKCGAPSAAECPAKLKMQINAQCFRVNLIGKKRGKKPVTVIASKPATA
jgi:competence transcription factor ComK